MRRPGAIGVILFALLSSAPTHARLIDEMDVSAVDDRVRVRLQFTVPVRYLRHFPPEHGEILNVFLQALAGEDLRDVVGHPRVDETKRSPRNTLMPCFTVTYVPPRDPVRDPMQLVLQFKNKERFRVRLGEDSRSLILELPAQLDGRAPGGCNGKSVR